MEEITSLDYKTAFERTGIHTGRYSDAAYQYNLKYYWKDSGPSGLDYLINRSRDIDHTNLNQLVSLTRAVGYLQPGSAVRALNNELANVLHDYPAEHARGEGSSTTCYKLEKRVLLLLICLTNALNEQDHSNIDKAVLVTASRCFGIRWQGHEHEIHCKSIVLLAKLYHVSV